MARIKHINPTAVLGLCLSIWFIFGANVRFYLLGIHLRAWFENGTCEIRIELASGTEMLKLWGGYDTEPVQDGNTDGYKLTY